MSADVNGDGKPDLITANLSSSTLTVLTNNGNGGFAIAGTYAVGTNPNAVTAADLNGDGKVDLVSTDYGGGFGHTLTAYTNNGSGGFVLLSTITVGATPLTTAAADVNGDGKLDLISADSDSQTLSVLTNNGAGAFTLSTTASVGGAPYTVVAADLNMDGSVDLVSANRDLNTLTIFTNNGSGGFSLSASKAVGAGPWWVTAADINGDGKFDLITANYIANTLTILTNDGSGGFTISSSPSVGATPLSVIAADVNSDGWLDLISANNAGGSLTILTNNGAGLFALGATLTTGSGPSSVVAVDVNGDGSIDLASANYNANTVTVFTNSTPPLAPPVIITQPLGQTNVIGSTVIFSVTAVATNGYSFFNYQWRFGGTNLPAANISTLTLSNLTLAQAGNYDVVVFNSAGSVTSSPAILGVVFIAIKVNGQIAPMNVTNVGSAQVSFAGGFPGGSFYYTLDGSSPNLSSTLYAGPFTVTNSVVVNVFSLNTNGIQIAFAGPVNIQIIPTFNLQTSIVGNGTLSTNPPTGPYASNSVVILTATPATRWVFDHWAGDTTNTLNPLSITMTGPRNL